MSATEIQLVIGILTIFGSGVSVYVGIKVSVAEMRRDIANLCERIEQNERRLDRLENPFFGRPHR